MTYIGRRGRNILYPSMPGLARDEDINIISDAEYYLLVGRGAIKRLRRGSKIGSVCQAFELPADEVIFALHYARSSSVLQFRALVEDWTWLRIKAALPQPTFIERVLLLMHQRIVTMEYYGRIS